MLGHDLPPNSTITVVKVLIIQTTNSDCEASQRSLSSAFLFKAHMGAALKGVSKHPAVHTPLWSDLNDKVGHSCSRDGSGDASNVTSGGEGGSGGAGAAGISGGGNGRGGGWGGSDDEGIDAFDEEGSRSPVSSEDSEYERETFSDGAADPDSNKVQGKELV